MQYLRHLVALHTLLLVLTSSALADWTSRNRLELGMTDNALLTNTHKESDFFLSLGTRNSLKTDDNVFGLRLGYKDYSKENSNDVLSWGLSDRLKCWSDKTCQVELRGQEYVYGEPMTTDNSFSNYGAAFSVEKNYAFSARTTLDLTTAYEARDYYSLNRLDHILSENAVYGYELNPATYLEATGEIGLNLSSESAFSSYYILASGLIEYQLTSQWDLTGELGFKQTNFLSRDLTTETQITRKNGQVVSKVDTAKERYSTVFLTVEANRTLSSDMSAGFSLQNYSQKSRSGYQDYNETVLLGKFLVNY